AGVGRSSSPSSRRKKAFFMPTFLPFAVPPEIRIQNQVKVKVKVKAIFPFSFFLNLNLNLNLFLKGDSQYTRLAFHNRKSLPPCPQRAACPPHTAAEPLDITYAPVSVFVRKAYPR